MKKFWLILFPDTFIWLKNSNGIVYNSQNFKQNTFLCSDEIIKLCDTLSDPDSLYSVEITESLLQKKHVKIWIDQITTIQAGCMIEQNTQNSKFTSYYPLLSIHHSLDKIILEHNENIGGEIIENLHELVFYINGSLQGSDHFFRQTYYPLKTNMSIEFTIVESFIKQCNSSMLHQITFIGDIFNYKCFEQLQKWIISNDYFIQFVLFEKDLVKNIKKLEKLDWLNSDKISLTVIVSTFSEFSKQTMLYQNLTENVTFVFPIESIKEFTFITSILTKISLKNYNIVPLFNGTNKNFFEEKIYITKDDFIDIKLSRREIFINMTLNVGSFGKLTIMPDGKIYSNVNDTPLGSIGDSIYNLIFTEMTVGKMWFRIRNMKPCCDCIYQWLCPSPSNYELTLGKPNLCHISS